MTTGRAVRAELSIIADFGPDRQLHHGAGTGKSPAKRHLRCAIVRFARYSHLSFAANIPFMSTSTTSARPSPAAASHKNKTGATFLALILGGVGAHRFYLRGSIDKAGLLHVASLPIAGLVYGLAPEADWFFKVLPLVISYIAGFIEGLAIGLMSDEKFDLAFNARSGRSSQSRWVLALLLVTTMLIGAVVMIFTLARLFDLLATGGAYG